jgi:hypothetical protein
MGFITSVAPSATYQLPASTIFDEDVAVWTLVKYIFKVMFAFIIVNVILTLPVVLIIAVLAVRLSGGHLPTADDGR